MLQGSKRPQFPQQATPKQQCRFVGPESVVECGSSVALIRKWVSIRSRISVVWCRRTRQFQNDFNDAPAIPLRNPSRPTQFVFDASSVSLDACHRCLNSRGTPIDVRDDCRDNRDNGREHENMLNPKLEPSQAETFLATAATCPAIAHSFHSDVPFGGKRGHATYWSINSMPPP